MSQSIARSVAVDLNAAECAGLGASAKHGAPVHGAAQAFYAGQLGAACQVRGG